MMISNCSLLYLGTEVINKDGRSTKQSMNMFISGNIFTKVSEYLRTVWSNITLEPVMAMYCLIIALSEIPGEELYLKKACKVNLNHSMEICDNIYDYEEAQVETQKLVSGVQVNLVLNQKFTLFPPSP